MTNFDDDLRKQRRNLILISVALIVFDFADVRIAKVGILGTDLIVGNPNVLIATAWICWLYFLLRYFQYWMANNKQGVKRAYYDYLHTWGNRQIQKIDANALQTRPISIESLQSSRFLIVEKYANVQAGMDVKIIKKFSVLTTLRTKLQAIWHVAVVSPHFVDQIFPFALALLAPVVTAYTQWDAIADFLPNNSFKPTPLRGAA